MEGVLGLDGVPVFEGVYFVGIVARYLHPEMLLSASVRESCTTAIKHSETYGESSNKFKQRILKCKFLKTRFLNLCVSDERC